MNDLSIPPHEGITNWQVAKSVLLHLGIILAFTINAYLFPAEDLNFESAIRVDIVGLPEKLKHLPTEATNKEIAKPTAPKVEPAPQVAPTPTVTPAPAVNDKKTAELERKKAQQKAIERMKALEAISEIEEDAEKESKNTAVAGNVASAGNALTGILQNQISSYMSKVKTHVNDHWKLPQWMADSKLRGEALVLIDANGVVIRRSLVKTSGNSGFDDSILSAIDEASPFPAPPSALVGVFKNKGFTLGFPE